MIILDVSLGAIETWDALLQFCIIALAFLAGNMLRLSIPALKKSLIPTALIGGALLLLAREFIGHGRYIDRDMMEMVTFHALGMGFIALSLKNNTEKARSSATKVVETGVLTASTYVLQGIIGLLVTIPLYVLWKVFFAGGLLLPMGYGQGPGQAMNFGNIFSGHAADQGLDFSGVDFGLAIAATGFIVGSLLGVYHLVRLRKQGLLKRDYKLNKIINKIEDFVQKNEIPEAESIDKLSIQIGLVLTVYFFVYILTSSICNIDMGEFGEKTLKPMLWGFNFLIGTLLGLFVKWCMNFCKKKGWIQREYSSNYLLNRISGFCFDVMILAGTAAISFAGIGKLLVPFILVCTLGAVGTFFYLKYASNHLYKGYENEAFLSMLGTLTGTASNGMILLREIDPKFGTPAANNLVMQNFPAILFGLPILFFMGFAPLSFTNCLITFGILIVIFIAFNLFLFRKKIFRKKEKKD